MEENIFFLPHFHYNKDWNAMYELGEENILNFLPHFHYNKDWNNSSILQSAFYFQLLTPLPL